MVFLILIKKGLEEMDFVKEKKEIEQPFAKWCGYPGIMAIILVYIVEPIKLRYLSYKFDKLVSTRESEEYVEGQLRDFIKHYEERT